MASHSKRAARSGDVVWFVEVVIVGVVVRLNRRTTVEQGKSTEPDGDGGGVSQYQGHIVLGDQIIHVGGRGWAGSRLSLFGAEQLVSIGRLRCVKANGEQQHK